MEEKEPHYLSVNLKTCKGYEFCWNSSEAPLSLKPPSHNPLPQLQDFKFHPHLSLPTPSTAIMKTSFANLARAAVLAACILGVSARIPEAMAVDDLPQCWHSQADGYRRLDECRHAEEDGY